jgi:S-adenosylmethionine hydrolase
VATAGGHRGQVVLADRFGNLITNLSQGGRMVRVAGREVAVVRTYGDVAPGTLVALIGSFGALELAVTGGNAAAVLGDWRRLEVELIP